jgi:ABC-type transport system substrate-binding protein
LKSYLHILLLALTATCLLTGCFDNNPNPPDPEGKKVLYFSYSALIKHLDPAKAYNSGFYRIMTSIYEPPFEFHYLKHPAELVPRTAADIPEPVRYDSEGNVLSTDASANQVAKVVFTIRIRPGISFQDHACFARTESGEFKWHLGPGESFPSVSHPDELLQDLSITRRTRNLEAADFVYQFKRLANPMRECPVRQVFESVVLGMKDFRVEIENEIDRIRAERRRLAGAGYNQERDEQENPIWIDYDKFDLPGVQVVDDLTYTITVNQDFPQLLYWMTMPFFSPIPREAVRFYFQHAAAERNFTLDRHPVGTGPYTLTENRPNYRLVLDRNPNFREELYPAEGSPGDMEAGLLDSAGKPMPFVDRAVYLLDREAPPRWNKFLQGYYDIIELEPADNDLSGQVMELTIEGQTGVTADMQKRGVALKVSQRPFIRYYAFNMRDPVVGGLDEKRRKLRQAISIALDIEQYIQIFENGRGKPADGLLPDGIFGHGEGKEAINSVVYRWDETLGRPVRRSIEEAKKLMIEAGYPGGRDAEGNQLVLNYDLRQGRGVKTQRDWMNKQLGRIGIKLETRTTDANRWLAKLEKGNFQFIYYGWYADYPDPENFMFLLYGPNGKVDHHGENYANYQNAEYDKRFLQMKNIPDSPERSAIIKEMLDIAREDAPWIFAWQPTSYALHHSWLKNYKPKFISEDLLKYLDINAEERQRLTGEWNRPVTWPVTVTLVLLLIAVVPATVQVVFRQRKEAAK